MPATQPAAKLPDPYPGLPIGPSAPPDLSQVPFVRNVPTDERAVVTAGQLPPISGGTLAITSDDKLAVVADPDRDRVSLVDLTTQKLVATLPLNVGDEPGRVALDNAGHAYVALRRGGAVVTIDTTARTLGERRQVCAAPRGVEFDARRQLLVVACSNGDLVSLPLAGTAGIVRQYLADDLRDVLPRPGGLFVSRFKSAELLAVDDNGALQGTARPELIHQFFPEVDGSQSADTLDSLGARRVRMENDGTAMMLHQTARNGEIELASESGSTGPTGASPYGGMGSCSGVTGVAFTDFDPNGVRLTTRQFTGASLPVDFARAKKSREIAVASAGAIDPFQPIAVLSAGSFSAAGQAVEPAGVAAPPSMPGGGSIDTMNPVIGVARFDPNIVAKTTDFGGPAMVVNCMGPSNIVPLPGPATAVSYLSDDRLVVQTREPAAVFISYAAGMNDGSLPIRIDLGGASVLDTGHEIFHRDAGAGVACATCHLEGEEDGHTWHFADQGPRRTQALSIGLEGTAPFHWVGDMTDLGKLMENVFVGRMGGVHQATPRLDALARWMFSIRPPLPLRAADDVAVIRGHELFVGAAECSKCHDGPKLTNNQTVDVGTGLALQVPSLIGVGYRAPWIHTGCAKTLQQRFDPACGGNTHGKTAQLTTAQIDDLVAYLQSI
jgi:mono/diheme cytochrome c family protein